MAPPRLQLEALGHAFGERVVLHDVTLAVEPGESLALFGANGAGKSTLLRCAAGLLRPLAGSARIDDHDACEADAGLRRRIGYVGHRPLVWAGLSCRENLELFASLYGVDAAGVDAVLELVGLQAHRDVLARALSQGLRQRLALARALLPGPELLVLDEPHAGLDDDGRELVDRLVRDARGRTTVLLATHDRARGRASCSRTALLERGVLAAGAAP